MSLSQKRKNPEPKAGGGLAATDSKVLDLIKSKEEMAISIKDLKFQTKMADPTMKKCLKNLQTLGLIKELNHFQQKGSYYIGSEFEPLEEITGSSWFVNGVLDTVYIDQLKKICEMIIRKQKVETADGVYEFVKKRKLTTTECTDQQIREILRSLVLDDLIIEVISTGVGEDHLIPVGKLCYKCRPKDVDEGKKTGVMVSIPCGICPRIRQCTPDGLISPGTCAYYTKWLDF